MVWPQRGLLIWFIPNYKGQVKLSLQTHRHTQRGVMQAFTKTSSVWTHSSRMRPFAAPALLKTSISLVPIPAFTSRKKSREAEI